MSYIGTYNIIKIKHFLFSNIFDHGNNALIILIFKWILCNLFNLLTNCIYNKKEKNINNHSLI